MDDTGNYSFILLFLQSVPKTSVYSNQLKVEINDQFRNLILIVFGCAILLFLAIWILILRFTQRITHPINQLTRITEIVKRATGREGREKVLSVIDQEPIFEKTKKQLKLDE